MTNKQKEFIETVGNLARYEYTKRGGGPRPSQCDAQAILESSWNLKAKTLFGIKGNGIALLTTEWNGKEFETVKASFKNYPNIASAVCGYYDLLTFNRYKKVVNAKSISEMCAELQKSGYATDPNYGNTIFELISQYNLVDYDRKIEETKYFYNHDFKVGDKVRFSTCYASSTDPTSKAIPGEKMKKNFGTITRIRENSPNPYLLDDGLCWINKGDVREILN